VWTVQTLGMATGLTARTGGALGPDVDYDERTGRVSAVFEVKAPALQQATDAALRHARELLSVKPVEIIVRTTEQSLAETEHPAPTDLLSLGDAAEFLGISATRVAQLCRRERIARNAWLGSGPLNAYRRAQPAPLR
jgi:hypothetical protein